MFLCKEIVWKVVNLFFRNSTEFCVQDMDISSYRSRLLQLQSQNEVLRERNLSLRQTLRSVHNRDVERSSASGDEAPSDRLERAEKMAKARLALCEALSRKVHAYYVRIKKLEGELVDQVRTNFPFHILTLYLYSRTVNRPLCVVVGELVVRCDNTCIVTWSRVLAHWRAMSDNCVNLWAAVHLVGDTWPVLATTCHCISAWYHVCDSDCE